jgi:hypothetical protein
MNQNKLTDYGDCTSPRLYNFLNKDYVYKLCFRYFGESGQQACQEKKSFCNQCCSHHVGIKYSTQLFKCKTICTKVINGLDVGIPPKNKSKKSDNNINSTKPQSKSNSDNSIKNNKNENKSSLDDLALNKPTRYDRRENISRRDDRRENEPSRNDRRQNIYRRDDRGENEPNRNDRRQNNSPRVDRRENEQNRDDRIQNISRQVYSRKNYRNQ